MAVTMHGDIISDHRERIRRAYTALQIIRLYADIMDRELHIGWHESREKE